MATGTLLPWMPQQWWNNTGSLLASGTVETFIAGTTTHLATYQDVALTTPQANPFTLDGSGKPPGGQVFATPGQSYKIVIKDSTGATVSSQDNVSAIPLSGTNNVATGIVGVGVTAGQAVYLSDGSGAKTAGQWYLADNTNAYSSTLNEVGIAVNAIASGNSGTITKGGYATGLTGLVAGSIYYVGTAGALTLTRPTTNARYIGQADTPTSLVLDANPPPPIPIPNVVTITSTGTVNNLSVTLLSGVLNVIRCNNVTDLTLTGLVSTGIEDGTEVLFETVGAGNVYFKHLNGGSSAANQFSNIATSGDTPISTGGVARFKYGTTSSLWRLTSHEQGAWITPTFAAGNFTGSASLTWTVAGGNVTSDAYRLSGRTLHVTLDIVATSTGGTASTQLKIGNAAWGGFTIAKTGVGTGRITDAGATAVIGIGVCTAAATFIAIEKVDISTWSNVASSNTSVEFQSLSFEVQ